jgi:hypothetical protein
MSDLELETENFPESGTYMISSFDHWNPLHSYRQPVFVVGKSDGRGGAVSIWAETREPNTGALKCVGNWGAGAEILGGTFGLIANGWDEHGVLSGTKSNEKAGVYGYSEKASGAAYGVAGYVGSAEGTGVVGYTAGAGTGVIGSTDSGDGVQGFTTSAEKAGVYGENQGKTGVCCGVHGLSSSDKGVGVFGAGANGSSGVVGTSNNAVGVSGYSVTGYGLMGLSGSNHGTIGSASAQTKCGVFGINLAGIGVGGKSTSGVGVLGGSVSHDGVAGLTAAPLDVTRIFVDPVFAGVAGVATRGVGVLAQSLGNAGVGLYATAPDAAAVFKGNVVVEGNLVVREGYNLIVQTIGNKNGVVSFADGSHRLLCAIESPEAWFEDFGEGTLVKGKAHIALDPSFVRVIDVNRMHVFITPYGETEGLYVSRRTKRGFDVTERKPGKSSVRFSWRVAARPKSAKSKRFASASIVQSVNRLGSAGSRGGVAHSIDAAALSTPEFNRSFRDAPKMLKRKKPKLPKLPKLPDLPKRGELTADMHPSLEKKQDRGELRERHE